MFLKIGDLILNTDHVHSVLFHDGGATVVVEHPLSGHEPRRLKLDEGETEALRAMFATATTRAIGQSDRDARIGVIGWPAEVRPWAGCKA